MGWFRGNIDGIRQNNDGNIYEILFEDGDTEEWHKKEYDKNADDACIPIGNIGFRFIKKFSGGYFFSGQVVGIQSNDKRKCKFDEYGDIQNYTLDQQQAYSTKQTYVYNDNYKEGSRDNCSDDYNGGNRNNYNDTNDQEEK